MKVKSWLPATVSFASIKVKWSRSPSALFKSVTMSGSKLNKPISSTDDQMNTSSPPAPVRVSLP